MFWFRNCVALALFLVFVQLHIGKVNSQQEAACGADQFQCYDGVCISASQKCDLKKDCADGTDEIFEQCFDIKCPEYQCAYGGCYAENMTCDGKKDCWDGTDEFVYDCFPEKESEIYGNCRNEAYTEFQCKESKKCISYTHLCDGREDCEDKSDEWESLCVGTLCPEDSFRCGYGGCVANSVVCDHIVDCRDGSDELQSICKKKKGISTEKDWIISVAPIIPITANVTPSSSKKSCTITTNNSTLRAKTIFNGMPLMTGGTVADQTMIRLSCRRDHDLRGNEFNACDDGSWKKPFPICLKNCEKNNIAHDPKLTSVCYNNGNVINCETSPLVEGTLIGSNCASGYKPKTSVTSAEKKCINGKWQNQGRRLECVVDCGKTFNTVDGFPWVVSIYQRTSHSNYEYSCLGVIIDPSYVVTVTSCFSEQSQPRDVVVVLGKHTVRFNPEEEHGFDYFQIANIEVEELKPIAVLELINPLILSAKVRPICTDRLTNINSPTSIMNHTVDLGESHNLNSLSLGEPLVYFDSVKNKYSLTHIVNEKNVIGFNDIKRNVISYIKNNKAKRTLHK